MKNHFHKMVLVAATALALGAVPSPSFASPETDHCLEPPYSESIPYCACIALAGGLSPVIPPSSWNCNPPG